MDYELVPAGTVSMALVIGFLLGFFLLLAFFWAMDYSSKRRFKIYFMEQPDDDKNMVRTMLDDIDTKVDYLATRTNTVYFRRLANEFQTLLYFLRRLVP